MQSTKWIQRCDVVSWFPESTAGTQLHAYLQAATSGEHSYADLPVTRAMQPLKMKEYMATGKPVVVSSLPSVTEWDDCLDIALSPMEFANVVMHRLETELPEDQRFARTRLDSEGWRAKAIQLQNSFIPNRAKST
jgi:hypothetical protein